MRRMVLQRLGILIPTGLLASFFVFLLLQLVPGDPAIAIAGENATPQQLAAIRDELGVNDRLVVQYWHWLTGVVHGDLGNSGISHRAVTVAIGQPLPITLGIVAVAMVFAVVI